jgi:hypothetical protein
MGTSRKKNKKAFFSTDIIIGLKCKLKAITCLNIRVVTVVAPFHSHPHPAPTLF